MNTLQTNDCKPENSAGAIIEKIPKVFILITSATRAYLKYIYLKAFWHKWTVHEKAQFNLRNFTALSQYTQ